MASSTPTQRQQSTLEGYVQRLAKIKRSSPVHLIAQATLSACATLIGKLHQSQKEKAFADNVAKVAEWIVFFDNNQGFIDKRIKEKVRKSGKLRESVVRGEEIVDGKTFVKTRHPMAFGSKITNLDQVNSVIETRLTQFHDWYGEDYEEWKKATCCSPDKSKVTPPTSRTDGNAHAETDETASHSHGKAGETKQLETSGDQTPERDDNSPTVISTGETESNDDENSSGSRKCQGGAAQESDINDPAFIPEETKSHDDGISVGSEPHVSSQWTHRTTEVGEGGSIQGARGERESESLEDSGIRLNRELSIGDYNEVTLPSAQFSEGAGPNVTNGDGGNAANSVASTQMLNPASDDRVSATPGASNAVEEDCYEDPEETEYDFLIYHEAEDEDEAKSIKNEMQKLLKDKEGTTTAKVCIPDDFHYKGIRPKPLMAAVKKSTAAAFYISENTMKMDRENTLLSSLDFLLTTAKKGGVAKLMVFVKGDKSKAEKFLKTDNPYLKEVTFYDVTASDFYHKKMTQVFRENQSITNKRRDKSSHSQCLPSEQQGAVAHTSGAHPKDTGKETRELNVNIIVMPTLGSGVDNQESGGQVIAYNIGKGKPGIGRTFNNGNKPITTPKT